MKIKSAFLASLMFATASCGVNKPAAKTTTLTQGNTSVTMVNHEMALASSCSQFTHVATINSSVINGHKLQATGLIKKNNLLFITYNTQYDETIGGLDVVSLSSTNVPSVLKSLLSENAEYADLKIVGNYLYMVGQKRLSDQSTKGLLSVVDISNPASMSIVSEMQFNGYYATSIDVQLNKAYISVPNLGTVLVDISNPLSLTNLGTVGSAQTNTLFVKRAGTKTLELGGTSTHNLMVLNDNGTSSPDWLYSRWIFAQKQEAPSRLTVKDNYLYTNGGNSGLTILKDYSTTSQTPVYSSSFSNYVAQEGTGNGLTVGSCNKLYQAMGEKGLLVSDISNKAAPVQEGTFDFSTDSGSANNVFYVNSGTEQFVFVADGLAGVKMVKASLSSTCACAGDVNLSDSTEADAHDGLVCKVYDLASTQPTTIPNLSALSAVGSFKASKLNVANQTSDNSFPLFPASLKYLKTYYAISCEGYLHSTTAGSTVLSLSSDDGSNLYIDDVKVIDNDGTHSAVAKTYTFNKQVKDYKIKVDYLQGPANQINLELKAKVGTGTEAYLENFFN